MSCVRCGRCCFYLVVVPSEKYQDVENLNFNDLKEEDDYICVDGVDTFCPYLDWDEAENSAVCKIHHKKWFTQTPCHRHNNPEFGDVFDCKIGPYIRSNSKLFDYYKNLILEKRHV